ncbi:PilN domain-containing protein [Botrimarina hoheduenensis]|uniref:Fimbrial assembly protein (PilN) n=1 Tax=Botrimarina hoheduenensis TaxID=2528000 RepID=A0A5C5WDB0_9BACT|nr:PilN domain-containing protein [Botrimarina hoheduenensis]TWT48868.1 Fimbrial assembly protein (PilN) [Botrimarina hoheduenensis]
MSLDSPPNRRQLSDRRQPTTRRRHADSRTLYVELCHSVLRVVLVIDDGREELPTLVAKTVRWRVDAAGLDEGRGLVELTAALRGIVAEHRLAGCRVSIAISSTLCVNRATSGPKARVEEELDELEQRSQLYLTLGPGPKTTAIGRRPIDARHEHALMTVANESTLELLVQAAEAAGLVVKVVESSLVALSRLYGLLTDNTEEPVILAQLDEDRFEVGVTRNDQLLVEYRPSSDATTANLGTVIDDHHGRLERFCRRQYGLGAMQISRLWLVGDSTEIEGTRAKTKAALDTKVLNLAKISDTWQLQDNRIPPAEMSAAIGLALLARKDDPAQTPNLMEKILGRAKTPLRPFLTKAFAPIAATLLIAAGLWALNLEQSGELVALRAKSDELRPAELRLKQLSERIRSSDVEIEHLNQLTAATPATRLEPLMTGVAHCLPDDVWLKQLRIQNDSQASVAGASYTEGGVYDFVGYLEKAPVTKEVALRGTGVEQTRQGPATSFDIEVDLIPPPERIPTVLPTGEKP